MKAKKTCKKKLEAGEGRYNYPNGATAEDRRRVRRTQRYAKKHGRM